MANYSTLTSDKNKNTALLLCIFGGWLGLHQFYVGRIGKGLVYMFTVGLFFIGWFCDIISILLGTFRDNVGAPLRATKEQNNTKSVTSTTTVNQTYTTINQSNDSKSDDNISQLEKLAKLKETGVITEEEFNIKKKQLLDIDTTFDTF